MPTDDSLLHSFAALLTERALDDYGLANPEPSVLALFITDTFEIEEEKAEALAWGEPIELDSDDLDKLSDAFSLHRDLLACLVRPASSEIIAHVLSQTSEMELEDSDCPLCLDLADQICSLSGESSRGELLDMVVDLLGHLTINNQSVQRSDNGPNPLIGQLDLVVNSLPSDSQMRVLAYAYQELANTTDGQRSANFVAYSKLRSDYLSPLARQVLDLLAVVEDCRLPTRIIANDLGLANGRPLGQLPRSLARSLDRLNRSGIVLNDNPLIVSGRPGAVVFALSDRARTNWQALVQADGALEKQGR